MSRDSVVVFVAVFAVIASEAWTVMSHFYIPALCIFCLAYFGMMAIGIHYRILR